MSLNSSTLPPLEIHCGTSSPTACNNDDMSNLDIESPSRVGMSLMQPTYPVHNLQQYQQKEKPFGEVSRFRMVAMQAINVASVRNSTRAQLSSL